MQYFHASYKYLVQHRLDSELLKKTNLILKLYVLNSAHNKKALHTICCSQMQHPLEISTCSDGLNHLTCTLYEPSTLFLNHSKEKHQMVMRIRSDHISPSKSPKWNPLKGGSLHPICNFVVRVYEITWSLLNK